MFKLAFNVQIYPSYQIFINGSIHLSYLYGTLRNLNTYNSTKQLLNTSSELSQSQNTLLIFVKQKHLKIFLQTLYLRYPSSLRNYALIEVYHSLRLKC
jgi:hypothetical protein